MGKISIYIGLMAGLSVLFYLAGLIQNTPNAILLNTLLNPTSFFQSGIVNQLILVLSLVTAGGVVAATLLTDKLELALTRLFVIYLFNVGIDFVAVIIVLIQANAVWGVLITPFLFVYAIQVFNWWRGIEA